MWNGFSESLTIEKTRTALFFIKMIWEAVQIPIFQYNLRKNLIQPDIYAESVRPWKRRIFRILIFLKTVFLNLLVWSIHWLKR